MEKFEVDETRTYILTKKKKPVIAKFLKPKFELDTTYYHIELQEARDELKGIVGNLRKAARTKGLDPSYLFDVVELVGGNLFQHMFTELSEIFHKHAGEVLSRDLLNRLIRTYWVICLQSESATGFFRKLEEKSRWAYHADWLVTHKQYRAFMMSLDEDPIAKRGNGIPGINAQSPLLVDFLRSINDGFSILCRDLTHMCFVIDDHQIPAVGNTDSHKKKRNEKKAASIGVVLDVAATSLIRMPCILSSPHGTVKTDAAMEDEIRRFAHKCRWKSLRGTTWFLDRGYGRLRPIVLELKGDYIATVKRGGNTEPETPFTFDPPKNTSKKILKWMRIIDGNGGPMLDACLVGQVVYVAYRHRPGKVVLIATTISSLAFSWTLARPRFALPVGDRIDDAADEPIRSSGVAKLNLDSRSDDDEDEERESDDEERESNEDDEGRESDEDDLKSGTSDGRSNELLDDGSDADLSDEGEEFCLNSQHDRGDEGHHDEVYSSALDNKRGFSQLLSNPPMASGVLRLNELGLPVDGTFDMSDECLNCMTSSLLTCRELTCDQRSPIWFCARTGVASSTAMSVILRVDAHCIIRDKILGFESHNVLAGSLISPVDLLLGVLPPHVDEDLQIRIAEEVDTWESLDDNEKDEFLREYCKSGRDYLDRWHELLNHKVTPTKDQHPYCGPLEDLTKEELISAAKVFGITLPSNKNSLSEISELVSTGREQFASKGCDLLVALIDGAWGFRPLSGSEAMRNGSIAEPHAREKLPGFIRAVGQALHSIGSSHDFAFCSEVFELGLLEADGYPYVVTSVDGSLFVSSEANPENPDVLIQMVWENKTLFSETTIDEAKRLESDYGCYSLVEFKNDDSMGELQRKLANFGARKLELMQIVHHAAVTGSDVIYTLMDGFTGEFIRMVRISFDEEWRQLHLSTIQKIFCHHVPSTFNESVTMKIGENKAGVTWNELSNVLKMREAIRAGSLDEAAGRFLPTVARIWNRTKSAVDAQSKEVISLRVKVGGDLRRKLICESLLFLLVGSVRLLRAHTIHDDVDRLQGRDHILRAMTLVGSTRDLVQRAIDEIEVREPKQIIVAPILTGSVAQFFRTPAPSSANYNPSDFAWEIRAKTEVENVASTSALKAEAFNEGILKEVRLHETPGSWHIHTAVQGNRGEREHCVVCCSECDQFWGKVTSAEIKGSTKEELADRLKAYHDRSTRRGYKSIVKCGCCRVTLCQKSRPALFGTEVSCWEVWHSVSNLVTTHPMFPPQHLTLSKRGNVTSAALVANETVKPTDSAKKRRKAASSTKNYHGSGVRRDNDDQDD